MKYLAFAYGNMNVYLSLSKAHALQIELLYPNEA